jgi:ABC-type nitrate/sulfonate/bicarbonate transport system ATPase subunit
MSDAPRIEVRDVSVSRDGRLSVLADLDLTVAAGEFVALVGPSGCGKSTLLDVLAGLLAPDRGDVSIDGRLVRAGDLALMPQTDALFPWRTLAQNIAIGPRLAGVEAASARVATAEALERFGLSGFEHHFPHALSGGMRQRAALARTLLSGRRGWLLDEPFGALDALTRADLRADLRATWAEHRPSVVLVTHDIEEAVLLADRVVVCGPRPMGITREIAVNIAHPRDPRQVADVRSEVSEALSRLSGRGVAA